MADKPFNDRDYDLFISYSHQDSEVVLKIANWLRNHAGVNVFLDVNKLTAGDTIATSLPEKIRESRSGLIFISKNSIRSGWIKEEYGFMMLQRTQHPDYKIIPIKLDDTDMPGFIQTTIWVNIREGVVNKDCVYNILSAIYPLSGALLANVKDIYVSHPWRPTEIENSNKICSYFIKAGFRLIGDKTDNKAFDPDTRIRKIMESCGVALIIAPNRNGKTSPYIEEELNTAFDIGMKYVLVAEDSLTFDEHLVKAAINQRCYSYSEFLNNKALIDDVIADVREVHKGPVNKHFSFFATSLLKGPESNDMLKKLVEQITGIECIFGTDLDAEGAQKEIIKRISRALFMIADVSAENYNTLIEAGIARGCGTRLFLVCEGKPWSHRFMLQDLEKEFYEDEMQLIGAVHKIAKKFGRRILNNEEAFKAFF